jgi:dihydrofolate synthase/folylpolyglutamate synthase
VNVGGASGPRPSLSYEEALAWLYQLQVFGIKLGLENMQRLISALQLELAPALVIHVAGTNGKGSVCAMIDSILRAQDLRTGLFTSPHLVTFRERIRINGAMISPETVAYELDAIRRLIADWDPHPTFFEITTALALKCFSEANLDVIILETGLGGRLDATNAVPSTASVITPIDLDHQKWLGSTVREIAAEKAGIIKEKTPVVSAPQASAAEEVIRERAKECQARLEFVQKPYDRSPIALRGPHQKQNAAVAIAAIRAANIEIGDNAIVNGLMTVEWPARFQLFDNRTVIDGAHNTAAARVLAQTWREMFAEQRATLVLAILSDKDLSEICKELAPISESVFLPTIRSERAVAPEKIAQALSDNAPALPHSISPTIAEAMEAARAKPNPILLTGSLHFAGEALADKEVVPPRWIGGSAGDAK